jgi:catechol 2,3-dioxygenase-like lactoylglutathione lyase family enzyme
MGIWYFVIEMQKPARRSMFKNTSAFSSFSVDDLEKAKRFYTDKLGLTVKERPEGLELHLAGGTVVFIYESDDYTPPEHTVQYDMPGIKTDKKGIFRGEMGPKAIAWFKDPADHILSVLQEK